MTAFGAKRTFGPAEPPIFTTALIKPPCSMGRGRPAYWNFAFSRAFSTNGRDGGLIMQSQTVENLSASSCAAQQSACPLIASDRVEGTPVYRSDGYRIGAIERLMIGKEGGKVAYAVLSFGGILGFGEDHYPVPWDILSYNKVLGGYEIDISDAMLKSARQVCEEQWNYGDRSTEHVYFDAYGIGPYL
jgi:hypothetical protein